MTTQRPTTVDDPWQRLGWAVWAPWMLFLAYPAIAAARSEQTVQVVLGLLLTAGFAVVYAGAISRQVGVSRPEPGAGGAVLAVSALLAIALAFAVVVGSEALSFAPFLVAFGAFGLPRPGAWFFIGAVLAVTLAVPVAYGDLADAAPFLVILLAVTGASAAGRVMADQGQEFAQVSERLAIASERERVARDVHDVLGHSLTVISVKTELAARLLDRDPRRAAEELAEVQQLARQSLAEVRSTVGGLRSAGLDDELASARSALDAAGIDLQVIGDAAGLDPRRRTVAGWVVREGVTNVVRHSRAAHCEIGLAGERIWIADDGVGIDSGVGEGRGNGLRGLDERVRSSGGSLLVGERRDGVRGTRVEVTW